MEQKPEKYYFLSDAHLGSASIANAKEHEQKLVSWLDMAAIDATGIYLLGDIFDFWFEYRATVPKGFTLLLGKLRELTQRGVKIHFFTGNHDIWTFGYLEKECGLIVHKEPIVETLCGKSFFLAHGDGLGEDSRSFKFLRWVFHNSALQWMFRTFVPPTLGLGIGYRWSLHNREKHIASAAPHFESDDVPAMRYAPPYRGEENEALVIFAKNDMMKNHYDYYIFGHRHIVLSLMLDAKTQMAIIGDFMFEFTYATFDGVSLNIENWE